MLNSWPPHAGLLLFAVDIDHASVSSIKTRITCTVDAHKENITILQERSRQGLTTDLSGGLRRCPLHEVFFFQISNTVTWGPKKPVSIASPVKLPTSPLNLRSTPETRRLHKYLVSENLDLTASLQNNASPSFPHTDTDVIHQWNASPPTYASHATLNFIHREADDRLDLIIISTLHLRARTSSSGEHYCPSWWPLISKGKVEATSFIILRLFGTPRTTQVGSMLFRVHWARPPSYTSGSIICK